MTIYTQARMGEFLRYYKPPLINFHILINALARRQKEIISFADITTQVKFPDVSFYQGEINFDVMQIKTPAIILRVGQNLWIDEQFERNYSESTRVGMVKGAYWFYDDRKSPGEQAELLISLLSNKTFEMEVYIDWENTYGGQFKGLNNVVAMMQAVEKVNLNIKAVGLYSGYYWFKANSNPITNASQYAYLSIHPFWEAWYTNNPANVLIPAPLKLTHWQFGTPTVDWGQETLELDMNYHNGTQEEFDERYQGVEMPTEPYYELRPNVSGEYRSLRGDTDYPAVPHIYGVTSSTNRILAGNSAKALPNDFYVYQSNVSIDGVLRALAGDKWWLVYEANGTTFPTKKWVAEIHLGRTYLTLNLIGDVPPVEPEIVHVIETYSDGKIRIDGGEPF